MIGLTPLFFALARIYAYCYVLIRDATGVNCPGLGFLLRRCRRPRVLKLLGEHMYFEPAVASSYGLHIIGCVHEPESHSFLNGLFDALGTRQSVFVEVGANVGAILLDVARRPHVRMFGFEPSSACVSALRKTMAMNGRENCSIYETLVGEFDGAVPFSEGKNVNGASVHTSADSAVTVQQLKLDSVVELGTVPDATPTVLLIDVEGYEPKVLLGAAVLISRLRPLVIFEYNHVSKRHFHIDQIASILGQDYQLYRLRKDAMLDRATSNAWNCVAVPKGSKFETILDSQICAA